MLFLFFSNHKVYITPLFRLFMAEICVNIPEEWKQEIEESGLNISLIIRFLLKKELEERVRLRSIISKSKLTEKDVEELSEKIDNSLSKKFRESIK